MGESSEDEEFCVEDEVCDGDVDEVVDEVVDELEEEEKIEDIIIEDEGIEENVAEKVVDEKAQEIMKGNVEKSNEKANDENVPQKITTEPAVVENREKEIRVPSADDDTLKEESRVYEAVQLSPLEDIVDEVVDEVVDELEEEEKIEDIVVEDEGIEENVAEKVVEEKAQEIMKGNVEKSNEKTNGENVPQKITVEPAVVENREKEIRVSAVDEDTLKEEACVYEAAQLSPLPLADIGKEVELEECMKVIEIVEISDDEDIVSKRTSKDKRTKSPVVEPAPVSKNKPGPGKTVPPAAESLSLTKEGMTAMETDQEASLILKENKTVEEIMNQRKEPLPEVALFVDSLTQVSFDWKKYTCFYCNPCQIYVTSTALWEEHMSHSSHKKNLVRWKACNALQKEIKRDTKPRHEKDVVQCKELITGSEFVTEVSTSNGNIRHFVCRLCNSVSTSVEFLLSHLTGFIHIDNFMEHVAAYLYVPPTRSSLPDSENTTMRKVTSDIEKHITNEARRFIGRYGRGKMTAYCGELSKDFLEANEEQEELEETVLASQVNEFLSEEQIYNITCDLRSSLYSVANKEYNQLNAAAKEQYIGLQYLLELWAPSRRVIAVWYCMLCDSLVIDWTKHCEVVQHIAAYLKKDYKKYVFDCAVLEANNEEELRNNFIIAKSKVLHLEGFKARIKNVVHIKKMQEFDSFVAINAKIAKQLVAQYKIEVGSPPRQSLQKAAPSKSSKNAPSSAKPSSKSDSSTKNEQAKASIDASNKRPDAPKSGAEPSPAAAIQSTPVQYTDKPKSGSESTQAKKPDPKSSSQNAQPGPAKVAPRPSTDRNGPKTSTVDLETWVEAITTVDEGRGSTEIRTKKIY